MCSTPIFLSAVAKLLFNDCLLCKDGHAIAGLLTAFKRRTFSFVFIAKPINDEFFVYLSIVPECALSCKGHNISFFVATDLSVPAVSRAPQMPGSATFEY